MTPSWPTRLAGVLAVGLAVLLPQPSTAHAHASERSSSPEAGAVLEQVPTEVAITFDSPIMDIGAALVVRDGSGADATAAAPVLERSRIVVPLRADSARGDFSVAYRVVSEDGHAITAQYAFTVEGSTGSVAGASTTAPAPTASPTPDPALSPTMAPSAAASQAPEPTGSTTPWGLILAGAAALGIALVAAAAVWKRRTARRG